MSALEKIKALPLRQVQSVKDLLWNDQARAQLQAVAAKHMNPERMMRVVANAIRTTPKLQECDPMSFLGALMHCASMGLEPNTPLGHAYLIPFENKRKQITEVQVVIGYKGFIDLARRSGQLATIHGDVVYDDDEIWSHEYGSNQHLRHRPGPREGKRIGAYCFVKLNLGDGVTAEGHRFMSMPEIVTHRNKHSQGWKTAVKFGKTADSPWDEKNPAFESMAIKTVVRALANRGEMPMSIEFMDALDTDEGKGDYRAFAMDPTAGLQSEPDDGDTIEGETVKDKPAAQEAKPIAQEKKQASQDKTAVAKAETAKAQADPVAEDRETAQSDGQQQQASLLPDEAVERDFSQSAKLRQFVADVESVGWDAAMDLWEQDLDAVKGKDPDLHAAMMAAGTEAQNNGE